MKTHSSILAWEIPWTEESGGLQSMGWKGLRHNLVTKRYRCQHECVVVSRFHLQFPNNIWHWASFHVLNFHLSNFLGELSDHIFCLLFNRVVYFFYCWVFSSTVLYQGISLANIFSLSVTCLLIFLTIIFLITEKIMSIVPSITKQRYIQKNSIIIPVSNCTIGSD